MFERCLYFNTNALTRTLNAQWDQAFARYDLVPSHAYLLRIVLEKPGLSQQDIANELQLEKSTIARFLAQLEARDLIVRRVSDTDTRQNAVFPTKQALALESGLSELGNELYARMCKAIGTDNVKVFVEMAREINGDL